MRHPYRLEAFKTTLLYSLLQRQEFCLERNQKLEARLYTFLQDRFDRLTDTVENQKDFIIEDITKQL